MPHTDLPQASPEIIYQDAWLVAVHKPAGLLVHRSMIDRHETRFAMQMVRDRIGRHVFPVHRLDKPTSGILLFALDRDTACSMGERFSARETEKEYLAIVRGYTEQAQVIDYPLKEELDRKSDQQANADKDAQPAVTEYERLATVEIPYPIGRYSSARYSLIRIRPETGRKHQIRRHMKHIFHPIVGDTTHGDGKHNQLFRERFGCHRLLLAATSLSFNHPVTDKPLTINAQPEASFQSIIERMGWKNHHSASTTARS